MTSLEWDLNYVEDGKFPYTLRAHKILYLDDLDVSVLKDLPAEVKKEQELSNRRTRMTVRSSSSSSSTCREAELLESPDQPC